MCQSYKDFCTKFRKDKVIPMVLWNEIVIFWYTKICTTNIFYTSIQDNYTDSFFYSVSVESRLNWSYVIEENKKMSFMEFELIYHAVRRDVVSWLHWKRYLNLHLAYVYIHTNVNIHMLNERYISPQSMSYIIMMYSSNFLCR